MADGEQQTNVISLEYRPDFDKEKAKEIIAQSYKNAGKGRKATWRKNHQEEVLNHRYDVFSEQLPPCIEAYEELEKWYKKTSVKRKLPNTKKYFPKVREETTSPEESKDNKLNLFQRKKNPTQENMRRQR